MAELGLLLDYGMRKSSKRQREEAKKAEKKAAREGQITKARQEGEKSATVKARLAELEARAEAAAAAPAAVAAPPAMSIAGFELKPWMWIAAAAAVVLYLWSTSKKGKLL